MNTLAVIYLSAIGVSFFVKNTLIGFAALVSGIWLAVDVLT